MKMGLLTKAKRKDYFKYLGLGEYNKANILKLERKYFPEKYCDGKWGEQDDNLILTLVNVKKYTKNFKAEEFRCGCGGKHCTGYPTYMKEQELRNLQTIRTKYGKPMTITSGMRCKKHNASLKGSSEKSAHLSGKAADFYIPGVTDTLTSRKSLIKYMKTLPGFNWAYGDGYGSNGSAVNAPNMGNAVHLDSVAAKTTATAATSKTTATKTAATKTTAAKTTGQKMTAEAMRLIKKAFKYCKYKVNSGWPNNAGNCIRFVALLLRAAGLIVSTKQDGLLTDGWINKVYAKALKSPAEALKMWKKRNGNNWTMIWNKGKAIPVANLREGDVLLCFNGKKYKHTAAKGTGTNIEDCTSSRGAAKRAYSKLGYPCKMAFRPTK